ncbi:type I polyketide synthase [Streptomyces chrestomyceticus]|uniref:type I polyketide synthase n=1 Tax=Streptomyces chrestomyceticus TaxID=68185 RepID=UPI0027DE8408|nr:SDR family NAD(P)-dependent oxidoreductase [Streptomyces chrestomyceticus]
MSDENKLRSYLKRAIADAQDARARLREVQEQAAEPVAIVGMGCRFPGGAGSPEDFWKLLASGGDAVGGFPTDRGWDLEGIYDPDGERENTSYVAQGAFLQGATEFDAGFFGISPREALAMDPQQRLLLESAWEALERAGIDPASLKESATGVFAGGFASGYGIGLSWAAGEGGSGVEGHLMTGNATSVLSGRLSYALGLEGPAVTVDTACSSSLVALHLAVQALRLGECSLALAGGVTVLVSPGTFVEFSRQQGLSADGRCRAFSEDADGTGWAEGVGMLVVERLSDARRNGHKVLAVLRGSAVNQDGASNGLSAPNGPSQQRVIRAALASAGLSASEVDVVEAHGTGTTLGDPIEAQALLATYGQDRPEGRPLWLGSVKSNIGHTQAAAGVAGVIKMVLALQHGQLPRTLHADEATSHVDWSAGEVRLLTESVPWPVGERPRRAGVSAFGISGTNAHVILEEAPPVESGEADEPAGGGSGTAGSAGSVADVAPVLAGAGAWVVSGRTAEALSAQAGRLREWVSARSELGAADVGWSLAATRSAFEHRAVVLGTERGALLDGVHSLAAGTSSPVVVSGVARPDVRVGLVFAGQGAQWAGMGRGLYTGSAVFAEVFDRVCGLLELELGAGMRLRDVVLGAEGVDAGLADQTLYAQAGLFAFEVALAAVLKAAGVVPDAVVGHSVGEVAAAHVAGVLSLPDACALVAARARLMQELPSGGAMAAVNAAEAAVVASFAEVSGVVAVAAVNGPESVVISGAVDAVDAVVELWRGRGCRVRRLRVSHAFHSPAMDPVLDELDGVVQGLVYHRPEVMWAGALTGELVSEPQAGYWPAQTRQTVRFADAVATLAREGVSVFLEVGPDGSLSSLGPDAVAGVDGAEAAFVALQRRTEDGATDLVTGLARAFVNGAPVDWTRVLPAGEQVELPTYAFRHQRYWPEGIVSLMPPTAGSANRITAGTEAEAEFWAAVEGEDLTRLAETLDVDGDRPFSEVLPALASWRRRDLERSLTADWRYRTVWSPVAELDARVLSGTWLVAVPAGAAVAELAQGCIEALSARGAEAVVVEIPAGTVDRIELAALVTGAADASAVSGVLSLLALDEAPLPDHPAVPGGLAATLGLVQALGDAEIEVPLWVATSGAVVAGAEETLARPVQAHVWGLGRVVALEHPERWGGLVDLPEAFDERAGARLVAVLAGCGENEVAVRAAGILGRRLAHVSGRGSRESWSPRGTVLVTGGTGAIAGHVSRWLAGRGAERLVLAGRSGPAAADVAAQVAELANAGVHVDVISCDVSERSPLAALLGWIGRSGPELSSVMHTAGVLDDGVLDRLSVARLQSVLAVKVHGAVLLDELTADLDLNLDAFVLFSAAAATLGGPGQGNYAAANAFLDALAENRRARGLNALAVAWGPWAGGGMAESNEAVRSRMRKMPMPPMDPQLAVRALAEALQGPDAAVAVMDVDWPQLASDAGATGMLKRPLVRDLPEIRQLLATAGNTVTVAPAEGELARQMAGLDRSEQERMLTEVVRGEAAVVLGYGSADAVEDRRAFKDLGFDSLTAVELRNRLNAATGLRLPSTLVFDYPTPLAMAAFLRDELTGQQQGTAAPVITVVVAPADEPLAIVGMACRFPGGVGNPEEFWEFLASGGDGVGDFPSDRGWDLESVYDPEGEREGTSYVAQGAFLRDAAEFDAGFFGISPREALAMDPQQRLLLETSWEALERAGIDPASLKQSATGVFAGGFTSGYGLGLSLANQGDSGAEGHSLTGNATSVLSGRVSYVLGLEGPAVTVDTACSSSLVALHLAAQAVRSGECSLALAGGATVMATPGTFIDFSRQQGLSADGRCRAFSEDADGTGWAEGAGMVVVERLSDARRNGHKVLAVLRGSAVNQDGASNGLTAPNGPSQQRVIRAALANARLAPGDVDVVEAHGTGTTLGDPIEAQALLATYGRDRGERDALWLGSVKSNIGHTQAAAGIAGVIKMVLALQHEQLPQTLYAEVPSSHVDWSAGAVRLLTEPVPWPSDGERVRRAAVSAFGMSGTNAHLILEEAPAAQDAEAVEQPGEPVVPVVTGASAWVLSGRTGDALAAQAGRLREWVSLRPSLRPVDVAWSLAATRSVFEHRAVVVGGDREQVLAGLGGLASAEPSGSLVSGVARSNARPVFAFAGQGSQWVGMGRELAEVSPVFAGRLAECAAALEPYVDWSLTDVLAGAGDAPALAAADVVQPALWAVMVSLAAVWEAAGVAPDAVVGHSQGEIAAATVAGMLSLQDGARVVALRSRALKVLAGAGGMLSVSRPASEVEERLARFGERLSLAAVNGPSATVVSGEPGALEELRAEFEAEGARARMVAVDYASHSAQVDRLEEEITTVLAGISPRRGRIPMISAMTGETLTGEELDAAYWYRSLRATVHYDRAVRVLAGRGHQVFVEVTPHPVLMGAMNDTLVDLAQETGGEPAAVCGTLRRDDGGAERLLTSLAEAFVSGAPVDWQAVLPAGEQVELPTYAFRRRRFWPEGMLVLPMPGSAIAGSAGASTDAEAAFWAAVEDGDLSGLGDTLALEGGRPFNEVLPALASWRRRERDRSTTAGWRYRTGWSVIAEPDVRLLSGTWLVIVSAESAAAELAQDCVGALSARGAEAVVVEVPAGTVDRSELAALLTGAADASAVSGVLSLLALDETSLADRPVVNAGLAATLGLVQALGDAGVEAPLWVATRGAVAAGRGEALARPVQAQVWGLGRVVALEHPERWGGLVDLSESLDERSGARLVAVLAGCGENEVAIRAAGILGRRLAHASGRSSRESWSPQGTVLVTGGTGAIAGHVSRWLAGRGAERLVLTSRSGPAAVGAAALAAELAAAGSAVEIVACDVSERAGLAGLLGRIDMSGPRLSSVMHTAGVLDDGVVDRLDTARLETVLGVKAHGAILLDELTADLDLDAFVLFSSAASTLGGPGQGNYAAANAFLDALAENRRGRGLSGLAVAWGLWGGGGLGESSEVIRSRMRRMPMPPMDPQLAVRALGEALDGPDAVVTVMEVDWVQLASGAGAAGMLKRPLVRDLPEIRELSAAPGRAPALAPAEGELAFRVAGLSRSEQDRVLTGVVRAEAAVVLGHDSADGVQARQAFKDLGFDSLTSVELRNRLNAATGLRLPATLVFDHPTPTALAAFLRGELIGDHPDTAADSGTAVTPAAVDGTTAAADEPLAIVGMACRFPGGASSPEEFWELLASGGDAVGGFPTDRGWDLEGIYDPDGERENTSYVAQGAFLQRAAEFDAGFFGISPREALAMDPQQRLMLETSWEALERAGIDPWTLRGSSTGVFAGGFTTGYGLGVSAAAGEGGSGVEGHLMTGNATSVLSGRVSYVLGLEGPAVTVDTACSSSLVALNLAAQSVRSGECSMALAGGVTVMATPSSFVEFSRQQGLSADGRCRAFSEDADGTGWAEGAGVLVVERLSDARRNGHRVLAVVRGTAVNQDGASNGLSAPNGPSQQRVIRAALANARLSAAEVDVVEAHGTGTTLGDPIEAQALLATYGRDRGEGAPLWLGSVKSNIGHTQAAAGVAGVIKMVLALQHGQLPRTLHADEATSHVDWAAGEVRLLTESVPWPVGDRPRRAGISAFGISGTNAHVILEEAPSVETGEAGEPAEAGSGTAGAVAGAGAWVVSGRTAEALSAQAGRLREWVSARPELRPADVAWSLAATRSAFEHRAVVLGTERDALLSGLHKLAAGASSSEVLSGVARPDVRVGLVFAGQGAQWAGMGRGLYAGSAVFAEAFDRVCGLLELELGTEVRLRDVVLEGDGDAAGLADQTLYAQAGLFAFEVALAAVLKAAGVVPDAVVGHSVGEVAAAHVAGVLSLPDACALVAARARLMQELPAGGAMAAINAAETAVVASFEEVSGEVAVAAVNGPESVVISGAVDAVDAVVELWRDRGCRVRPLRVSHAFHSPAMDPVLDELRTVAEGVEFRRPEVMWAGALTGELVSEPQAGYWPAQTRQAVRFADAVAALAAEGISVFLEVGPDGSLSSLGPDAVAEVEGTEPVFLPLQRRDDEDATGLLTGLARAFVNGVPVDWTRVLPAGEQVELPTYAFRHQRFWPEAPAALSAGSSAAGRDGAGSAAESAFWSAVESGDLEQLADTLAVDGDRPFHQVLPALASWHRRELDRSATADWRYRTVWSPVAELDARVLSGTWLVTVPVGTAAADLAQACIEALSARGAEAVVVEVPAGTVDRAELAALLTGAADASAVSGVLSLLALDEAPLPDHPAVPGGLAATLGLVQALGDAGIEAPLWAATSGAVAAGRGEALARPVQAQVWGLGRVVALEHPERWGGLVDLPESFDERSGARLVAVLAGCGENEVALRPSGILGRRLARVTRHGSGENWSPCGSVLITGGTGAIAGHAASWLCGEGAERLVLTSRSGPAAEGVAALAAELAEAGSAVEVVACDVSERAPLSGLLDWIGRSGPGLSSVMHTAGVLDDGVVDRLNTGRLETVLGVKVQGAVLLDELTADLDLDAFVLFSAAAATLGGSGQGNYAAANAYLDALAENRRARGLAGLAVAWGPWAGGGMAASSGAVRARVERGAMPPMDPRLAVRALAEALQGPDAAVTVMDVDWEQLASGPGAVEALKRPLMRDLPEIRQLLAAAGNTVAVAPAEGELARQMSGLGRSEQERLLTEVVRAEAAVVLGYGSADAVEDRRAFKDLGFDSLTAVELRNRLNSATGLRLPSTLVFDYPTPLALAAFLRDELTGGKPDTADAPAATVMAAPADEPLAIVGMACRFPGGVGSPREFWELLASGGDAIGDFPSDRGWDLDGLIDPEGEREGTSYVAQGAFLRDAAEFDAGFFGISPREALAMDPQQRLLLETSWEALERAGIDPASLRESATGVFAGGFTSGYGLGLSLSSQGDSGAEGHSLTGNATSVLSGRVSYVLGLEGPAVTVDTACSSSLVALHLAAQAVRSGECSLALAGGATVMATPGTFIDFSRQQGLSADGRCRAFSEDADGTGWAEGAGMVVVERLSDARRNGHKVLAVLRGSAVNQDGASNGLTAPNGPSQQRVIRAALANARLTTADIDVVEAHGTGTTLGDPIEAQAVLATYGRDRAEERPLWLGSVKSNIGHTQAAAGVAGVIKMVLALQYGQLPRTLHAEVPSSHVDWEAGAVRLLNEQMAWPSDGDRVRRAAVSAFGMSGTNAHLILEEAPAPEPAEVIDGLEDAATPEAAALVADAGVGAWVLSGRTADALAAQAGRLREWTATRSELAPVDVAWSLAATRSVFEHRAVVVGGDREQVLAGLGGLASGVPAGSVVSGVARSNARPVFAFAGQGSQWVGMGRELARTSPVFAARLAECAAALEPYVDWSISDVLAGAEGAPALEAADVVQPALWAVMVSLAAVWEAAGVVPEAVVGHSQGEIAAATVAGMLSLQDGARVVALRSRALKVLAGAGGMLSVSRPASEVQERLARFGDRLSLAAVNGPSATVVSGEPKALEELKADFEGEGARARMVAVDYASHSAQVDRLEEEITTVLAGISPRRGRIPMVSAMTGETLTGEELDAGYWFRSLRATVHYDRAVRVLASRGHQVFVEVTPHPVLMGAMNDTLVDLAQETGGEPAAVCGTLRRDDGGAERLLTSLAEAFVSGAPVDWQAVLPAGEQVELPTYAFRRRRFWPEGMLVLPMPGSTTAGAGAGTEAEAGFWAAVEDGDLTRVAETLALEDAGHLGAVLPALASWRRRELDRSATADWRYRTVWSPVAEPDTRVLTGTWMLLAPAGCAEELRHQCVAALTARGAEAVVVEEPAGSVDRAELAVLLTGAAADPSAISGVLSLLALDETPLADRPVVNAGLAVTLGLVQALGDAGIEAPLWVATSGAVAAGRGEMLSHPVQAQAWGLGRVVGLEHPERWGGLVDLPETLDERSGGRLVAVLAGCKENEVAIRAAGILGRRLAHVSGRGAQESWSPRGTVLVTGGTGAIAGHVSRWLVGRGAERLVLAGRSGPAAADVAARAAELATAGVRVDVISCDVSERAPVASLLGWIGSSGPELSSVMHTAGVLDDGVVDRLDTARLETVLGVKAHGAILLDELTADLDLDAFVLFSSAASTVGGPGQGNYAAANAFLDALAENRRGRGLSGLAVAWGLWGGGGLGESSEVIRSRMRRMPMPPMEPKLAVRALGEALDGPDAVVTVMEVDWAQLASGAGAAGMLKRPLVRDLPEIRELSAASGRAPALETVEGELAARVAGLSRSEQDRVLTGVVRAEAAAVLGHASSDGVQARQAFKDLGFDSLTSVELRNRLNAATGLRLPATLVFDHPTPTALAAFLRGELTGQAPEAVAAAPVSAMSAADEPLAIVGMACRFPGGASTPEGFWELLASGGDAVGGFPTDRGWDLEGIYDPEGERENTSYVAQGAFLRGAAEFDAGFFGISPREALAMDPQQRLMLETSWEALERAGIDPWSLRGSSTGVFAGGFASGYGLGVSAAAGEGGSGVEGHLMTGNATSVLSGRVSYVLGLEGPAVTVDTACSSSLVALNLAAQAVRSGECSMALAGGVTVMATPGTFIDFSRQQGLSADGRCRAFSEDADGTGWAEGAGMVVVERLSDARRNGHKVLAVLRGSAVNQDGASNGLTAPNGPSQQRVIRAALASAGLSASEVDVVEAHGTGTKLGDPIEAQALLATYGRDRGDRDALWLGSVKSNIGHTQAAAGVAGVIKMVLALQHGQLPRTLHADEATSHVDWEAGEVRLLTESVPWPVGDRPRRAGISAFGISGTNAHVILEEAPAIEARSDSAAQEPVVALEGAGAWVVSGRTAEALSAQAGRLREWVSVRPELRPADVAWSLAATRSAFEHRAVVLGSERDTLLSGVHKLAAGSSSPEVVSGVARPDVRVGLIFAGQGAQWAGMGRGLYAGSAVFAEVFDRVCGLLELELGTEVRLRDVVLEGDGDAAGLADQTLYAQTGLFAFEVALAEVLKAAGVVPDAVVGHSVGEVAAAHVAGVLSLPDACALVATRARLMQELPPGGAMAAINAAEADVIASFDEVSGEVAVAAVNGPESVVVSGAVDAVDAVVELWRDRGCRVRRLRVSHAFHSPAMDPVLDELRTVAEGVEFRRPEVMWAGALTGDLVSEPQAGYWPAQTRQTVRFADAVATLAAEGISVFLEVGPDGSLSSLGPDAVAEMDGAEPAFLPLQRRDDEDAAGLLTGLARAFIHGVPVDWTRVLPAGEQVELPTYAFRHQRFWPEAPAALSAGSSAVGRDGAGSAAESAFWSAVESGDLEQLADTLAVDGDRPFHQVLPALTQWRRRDLERSTTAGWRYRMVWEPVAEPDPGALTGTWLVVVPAQPAAAKLAQGCTEALSARGAEVAVVEVPAGTVDRAELAALLGKAGDPRAVSGVLSLLALDETPLPDHSAVPAGLAVTLALVQALGDADIQAPLWPVTCGAVAAVPGEVPTGTVQAQVWGLGRVIGMEHPDRWGGLVDLPEVLDQRAAARLAAVLGGCGEDQVAVRATGILGRRMRHAAEAGPGEGHWTPRGSALITGGTGAVGGHVARWLAEADAPRVVLTGRSGPAAGGVAATAAELAAQGTRVDVVACDVSDRSALAGLVTWIGMSGPALSTVLHTAAVLDDGVVDRLSAERLQTVLAAKAAGAAHLDELTAGLDLDAFVLFSSAASTLGSAGQGNYAAANSYLDALAENRRARGLTGLSVAWGQWGGGGMADSKEAIRERMKKLPLSAMDPRSAVRALGESLHGPDPVVTVMDVDWAVLAQSAANLTEVPLVRDLPAVRRLATTGNRAAEQPASAEGELARRLAGLDRAGQERTLTDLVRAEAAMVLGHSSAEAVQDQQAFKDLGFDSLTAVELRNRLNTATGLRVPVTLIFDHPTPVAVAAWLRTELAPDEPTALPVLDDLDRLEAGLLSAAPDQDTNERITRRLQSILSNWIEKQGRSDSGSGGVEIESATPDEMFEFLDRELGLSD